MSDQIHVNPDELLRLVGKTLGPTGWKDITQVQIDQFAEATGDRQWIHVDPIRAARESPFRKKTVAHGYFTLALLPGFFFSLLEVEGARLVVNLGAGAIRWPAPVRIPSRVRLLALVKSATPFESGIDLLLQMTIEIEEQSRPALEAEVSYRYYIRGWAQSGVPESHPPESHSRDEHGAAPA